MDHSALVAAAVALARDGWKIFPAKPDKTPACRNGCKDASSDPQRVHNLFLAARGATMIGMATGPVSGIAVLDIDPLGLPWLRAQVSKYRIPVTRTHRTPRGGYHLLFQNTIPTIKNSASKIARGIDTRGQGGYIIMPPSLGYEVTNAAPAAPFPHWLSLILEHKPNRPAFPVAKPGGSISGLERFVLQSQEGERNQRLFWAACRAVESGHDTAALAAAARQIGLSDPEIKASIASAGRHAVPK